uniref:Uncharacterized protein n=1 Tax=Kalanchoe fedtschenkoi TaxID=63787 RepID=A0A7N0U0C9_KALFE
MSPTPYLEDCHTWKNLRPPNKAQILAEWVSIALVLYLSCDCIFGTIYDSSLSFIFVRFIMLTVVSYASSHLKL